MEIGVLSQAPGTREKAVKTIFATENVAMRVLAFKLSSVGDR